MIKIGRNMRNDLKYKEEVEFSSKNDFDGTIILEIVQDNKWIINSKTKILNLLKDLN